MRLISSEVSCTMAAEEDDEDIWDSWEDMADSGELERRMEEREKLVRKKDQKPPAPSMKLQENKNSSSSVMMQEDSHRTLYKPQLRILKRPDSGGSNQSSAQEDTKSKPVHKTFAERQAQYAEARARILGSGADESSDSEARILGSGADESSDSEKSEMPRVIQLEQKVPENVLRLPRGPSDTGSKGFQVNR